jgi:hypothetical protein
MPVATQFATTIRTVVHVQTTVHASDERDDRDRCAEENSIVVVDCELRAYLPESLLLAVAIADENG